MDDSVTNGRILIFIVAYHAEKHIVSTLERIPKHLFDSDRIHVLCIDDGSSDKTAEIASQWVQQHAYDNITVLRNPVNQGYGGNQKLGYRLALEWNFDFVILLHGDGQYAPELLPMFIEAWEKTDSDVVIGSRMQSLRSAREGGMPFYKLIGNRVLTFFQNRLAGQKLSEWHSGYRAYSARLLRKVPFEINTNDFHFDTELLLQAHYVNAKFTEFPIPTHYGDEVCHVNGMKYAKDVLFESLRFRMHRMGMVCSLKYQQLSPIKYRSKVHMRYTSHSMALKIVQQLAPKTLADIGCGPGHVARECENLGIEVTGMDVAEPLPGMMRHFRQVDIERQPLPVDVFSYDAVLLLDVIEHLENPENFLLDLRNKSLSIPAKHRVAPKLILSTPNVAFLLMRLNLVLGRFNYAERGILDIGHKRLFTRSSLVRMLRDCGYEIERVTPVPAPVEVVMPGPFSRVLAVVASAAARIWPRMFAFQWLVVCHPRPGVHHLLAVTERPMEPRTARYPLPEPLAQPPQRVSDYSTSGVA